MKLFFHFLTIFDVISEVGHILTECLHFATIFWRYLQISFDVKFDVWETLRHSESGCRKVLITLIRRKNTLPSYYNTIKFTKIGDAFVRFSTNAGIEGTITVFIFSRTGCVISRRGSRDFGNYT